MSTVKFLEIRDRATCITAIAVKFSPKNEQERWLLMTAGFGNSVVEQKEYVLFGGINGGAKDILTNPYKQHSRTMYTAHIYVQKNFDELKNGQVIDVEFILGETGKPKTTENTSREDLRTEKIQWGIDSDCMEEEK